MKAYRLFGGTLLTVLSISALYLHGCKADVDMNHIDPTVQVKLGLALPIGTLSATIDDFLNGKVTNYIEVRDDGVLQYRDTFRVKRNFHAINLADYTSNATQTFKLTEQYPQLNGTSLKAGQTYTLEFPLTLTLNNVNKVFEEERIDSIWLREAMFTSTLSVNNFNMPYTDIRKLEIISDKNMHRKAGSVMEIPLAGYGYNSQIPISVEEFSINLMKDKTKAPGIDNVINQLTFTFRFTIVPTHDIAINSNSSIHYDFNIQFLDYHALWGWFKPSNLMIDTDTIYIAKEWKEWNTIQKLTLQVAEPAVKLNVTTSVGCPLTLNADYLYVQSSENSETRYATFDGNRQMTWVFPNYVNPITDPIGTVATNTYTLNETPQYGKLDELFAIRPDILGYKYEVVINQEHPDHPLQHRLDTNTDINVEAVTTLPFIFNPYVKLAYADSIKDINLTELSLDSLLTEIDVIDSLYTHQLKLVFKAENWLPFDIRSTFTFLDKDNNVINFQLQENDNTLNIAGPTKVENRVILEPGISTLVIDIEQDELNKLASVKTILYDAFLGDNTATVRLLDTSCLKISIGVATNVEAILNLNPNKE